MLGLHAVWPAMRERGGDVVVTASMAALAAVPAEPLYAASKAAVTALVRSVAPTWASAGVRVNAVCPSFTDTAIIEGFRETIDELGIPLLDVEQVADAFEQVLATGRTRRVVDGGARPRRGALPLPRRARPALATHPAPATTRSAAPLPAPPRNDHGSVIICPEPRLISHGWGQQAAVGP